MAVPILLGVAAIGAAWYGLHRETRPAPAMQPPEVGGIVPPVIDPALHMDSGGGPAPMGPTSSAAGSPTGQSGAGSSAVIATPDAPYLNSGSTGGTLDNAAQTSPDMSPRPPPAAPEITLHQASSATGNPFHGLLPHHENAPPARLSPAMLNRARFGTTRGMSRTQLARAYTEDGALHGAVW